jgi:hypothetical protein
MKEWLFLLRAHVLGGLISGGRAAKEFPSVDPPYEDIQEAVTLVNEALAIGMDDWNVDTSLHNLVRWEEYLETHENDADEDRGIDTSTGAWVHIQGLVSATSLNGKFGRITTDQRPVSGRIPVQLEVGQKAMLIKPENIVNLVSLTEYFALETLFAMVSCLDETTQWAFMKTKVSRLY